MTRSVAHAIPMRRDLGRVIPSSALLHRNARRARAVDPRRVMRRESPGPEELDLPDTSGVAVPLDEVAATLQSRRQRVDRQFTRLHRARLKCARELLVRRHLSNELAIANIDAG